LEIADEEAEHGARDQVEKKGEVVVEIEPAVERVTFYGSSS
jgi:hypothetical protein